MTRLPSIRGIPSSLYHAVESSPIDHGMSVNVVTVRIDPMEIQFVVWQTILVRGILWCIGTPSTFLFFMRVGGTVGIRMKPRIAVMTVGADDVERSLTVYREGLGLPTQGIIDVRCTFLRHVSREVLL